MTSDARPFTLADREAYARVKERLLWRREPSAGNRNQLLAFAVCTVCLHENLPAGRGPGLTDWRCRRCGAAVCWVHHPMHECPRG